MMRVKWLVHLCILVWCSVEDWKQKTVALWKIGIYGFLVLGMFAGELFFQSGNRYEKLVVAFMGCIPAIFFFGLSKASEEAVGYGDCWIILLMGISVGFWDIMGILGIALLGIFLWAVFTFRWRKNKKNREIPFLPFLTIGMAGVYMWTM